MGLHRKVGDWTREHMSFQKGMAGWENTGLVDKRGGAGRLVLPCL